MGTTLHAHIEVKKGDNWLHYAAPAVQRDYGVFAHISGERMPDRWKDAIKPVCTHHDLPEDMSDVTALCLKQDAADYPLHGKGFITASEIEELQKNLHIFKAFTEREEGVDLEEDIFHTYIADSAIAAHRGFDDVRIVFWYDN